MFFFFTFYCCNCYCYMKLINIFVFDVTVFRSLTAAFQSQWLLLSRNSSVKSMQYLTAGTWANRSWVAFSLRGSTLQASLLCLWVIPLIIVLRIPKVALFQIKGDIILFVDVDSVHMKWNWQHRLAGRLGLKVLTYQIAVV